jgi:hypothetical protein
MLLVGCLLLAGSGACGNESPQDLSRSLSAPIVGGTLDPGDPAVVKVLFGGVCSGTLVSPHVVLTAAHCVAGKSGPWDVCFGQMCPGGMTLTATMAVSDPMFVKDVTHDQAVLILPSVPPNVPPVPLNRTTLTAAMAGPARIVGFGEEMPGKPDNGGKYMGMDSWDTVDANWVHFPGSGTTACNGDSGGPALQMIGGCEVIIGIVSHDGGSTCLTDQYYNRVDNEVSFVDQYIQMADPGYTVPCGGSGSSSGSGGGSSSGPSSGSSSGTSSASSGGSSSGASGGSSGSSASSSTGSSGTPSGGSSGSGSGAGSSGASSGGGSSGSGSSSGSSGGSPAGYDLSENSGCGCVAVGRGDVIGPDRWAGAVGLAVFAAVSRRRRRRGAPVLSGTGRGCPRIPR